MTRRRRCTSRPTASVATTLGATVLGLAVLGVTVFVAATPADRHGPAPQVDGALVLELAATATGDKPGAGNSPLALGAVPVTDLHPGATRRLELFARNPYPFPVLVTAVTGTLTGSSDSRCPASAGNLTVGRHAGPPQLPVQLPADARGRIGHLQLRMPPGVANGCQGATFTVSLSATAKKAK